MAAELLGGADVGAVFGELLEAVLNEINKAAFKTRLRQIERTLQSNSPILQYMEKLNQALNRRNEETETIIEVIRKGKTLVVVCSKTRRYNCWRRQKYTDKLVELEESSAQVILSNCYAKANSKGQSRNSVGAKRPTALVQKEN